MKKSVIGIIETQIQAERIVDQLQAQGVPSADISVLVSGQARQQGLRL